MNHTGVDWLLPAMVFGTGLIGCLSYFIALIEWLLTKSDRDNAGDAYKHAKWFFVIERLVSAVFLLFFLPGFLIILRSVWNPLTFGQNVLFSYLFLLEKTLDAFTLGFFDSFNVRFVNPGSEVHGIAPYEVWLVSHLRWCRRDTCHLRDRPHLFRAAHSIGLVKTVALPDVERVKARFRKRSRTHTQ